MLASRLPFATGSGLLLALTTFWLLWTTINLPLDVGEHVTATRIDYTKKIVETKATTKEPLRKKPDYVPPERVGPIDTVVTPVRTPPVRQKPTPGSRIEIAIPPRPGPGAGGTDQDATPWVRIEPSYPPGAERRGIEGWVVVQFSVTAAGQVTDVVVVGADPPGVFDREAIAAVGKWRYRPKLVDGRPVERVGLQTRFTFTLSED